jgi:transposase InsO family protein
VPRPSPRSCAAGWTGYRSTASSPNGCSPTTAWAYTHSRSLRALLRARAIEHKTTRPHRPQTNGKVERYQQTMAREWAYGQRYRSSDARAAAPPHWLEHYNTRRRHSAIDDRPPLTRVHQVIGQNT